tara:strand:+ start:64 stop:681 length:618 start_codon:yes stop_codon:yes gene_type:complete
MAGYGLRPVNFASGGYSSGGFTEYPIASSTDGATGGETDDMYTGHFMLQEASGYVTEMAASPDGTTSLLSTVGVAVGFRYINSDGEPVWSQKYTGNAANQEAYAFIADDPTQQFLIQQDSVGNAVGQGAVGLNGQVIQGTGSNSTGLSGMVLDSSAVAATATFPLRIVGFPKDGTNENAVGTTTTNNLTVQINPVVHQRLRATGL